MSAKCEMSSQIERNFNNIGHHTPSIFTVINSNFGLNTALFFVPHSALLGWLSECSRKKLKYKSINSHIESTLWYRNVSRYGHRHLCLTIKPLNQENNNLFVDQWQQHTTKRLANIISEARAHHASTQLHILFFIDFERDYFSYGFQFL